MRKAFALILATVFSLTVSSQKPWQKLEMDSVTFISAYGTEQQYNYQQQIMNKSSHGALCLWIGAKALYLYHFALWLGEKYNVTWSPGEKDLIIKAAHKISNTPKAPEIKFKAVLDTNEVVQSVTITGPADDLIKIYIGYWELTPISLNELNAKKQIIKEFISDKVAIKWTGSSPIIVVEKNRQSPLDLFPIKTKE